MAAVEHLVGLQAQTPQSWYVGLWSRLAAFDPDEVGQLILDRALVRIPLMRSTIHLVSAADALALRPLTDVPIERSTLGAFGRHLRDVDRTELVRVARELVDEEPLLASELGRRLAARLGGGDPDSLAQGARAWLPMVQVPPRGIWRRSGQAKQSALETWLGRVPSAMSKDELVRRYLAAFGPATVADVQAWCGLTKLAEVIASMRPELRVFRDEDGRQLFDLPEAPRPDAETPAPVRFLYDYDNLLLSHADRSRVIQGVDYAAHGYPVESNLQPSSVLVDGVVAGSWTLTKAGKRADLTVRPFGRFTPAQRTAIGAEAEGLSAFFHTGTVDLRIEARSPR